jgi:hypothetical protein
MAADLDFETKTLIQFILIIIVILVFILYIYNSFTGPSTWGYPIP